MVSPDHQVRALNGFRHYPGPRGPPPYDRLTAIRVWIAHPFAFRQNLAGDGEGGVDDTDIHACIHKQSIKQSNTW